MVGALISSLFSFIAATALLIISISFIKGKSLKLVSWYKDLSPDEKDKFSRKKLELHSGKTLIAVSILTYIFSVLSLLMGLEMIPYRAFAIVAIIYLAIIIAITTASILNYIENNMDRK